MGLQSTFPRDEKAICFVTPSSQMRGTEVELPQIAQMWLPATGERPDEGKACGVAL